MQWLSTIWRLTINYFMEEYKMINVVIDYLSIPLARRAALSRIYILTCLQLCWSALLESPNDLKTNQLAKMNIQVLSKGTSYESKQRIWIKEWKYRHKVQNSSNNIELKPLEPIVGPRSRGIPGM